MRLLKVLVVLVVLVLGTLVGYAYLGDMDARSRPYSVPVSLTFDGTADGAGESPEEPETATTTVDEAQ